MAQINIRREIARQIILAQVASDAGKGIYALRIKGKAAKAAIKYGYNAKDEHIVKAISLINKNPLCGFIYYVERNLDQNGHWSNVIYFKYNGDQVSFHNFSTQVRELCGKGGKQRWDRQIGGSRQNCQLWIDKFNL